MTKLSDTQAILLSAAAVKVVGALLARGLAREEVTDRAVRADSALNTVWRNDDDGRAVLLKVMPEGLAAIGAEPADEPTATPVVDATKKRGRPKKVAATSTSAPSKTRADTKQAQLIAMLRRKQGATIAQIVEATGWQPHTVRGAFAGALKKKLGLTVNSEKVEARGRVYRIAD